jgi:hypothetical protein
LQSQAQYRAAERSEVWVNIGYRLSAFGFLACDRPRIEGNFGFKDQWIALEWVCDNIAAFGGELDGLASALGSHSPTPLFKPQEIQGRFNSWVYQQVCLILFTEDAESIRAMTCQLELQAHTPFISYYTTLRGCHRGRRHHLRPPWCNQTL